MAEETIDLHNPGDHPSTSIESLHETSPHPSRTSSPEASTSECPSQADSTIYQCEQCDYFSYKKQYFRQHVDRVHSNERPFKCPFCDYAGKRQQSLKEHLIVHSSEKPYECSRCNATFRKKGHLTKHVQMHSKRAEIKCHFCLDLFVNTAVMEEHMKVEHAEETLYMCEPCKITVPTHDDMLLHFATAHNQSILKCTSCSFMCHTEQSMVDHHTSKHPEEYESVKEPNASVNQTAVKVPVVLQCSECGFSTLVADKLRLHMQVHVPAKSTNKSTDIMKQSEKPKTLYKCFDCGHISGDTHSFISHITTHESKGDNKSSKALVNDPPQAPSNFTVDKSSGKYVCLICNYSCEHQRTIKAHIWKHSGHKDVNYPMFRNGPLSIFEGGNVATGTEARNSTTITTTTTATPENSVKRSRIQSVPTTTIPMTGPIVPIQVAADGKVTFPSTLPTYGNKVMLPKPPTENQVLINMDNLPKDAITKTPSKESDAGSLLILKLKSQLAQKNTVAADNTNMKVTPFEITEEVLNQYGTNGANVIVESNIAQFNQNLTGLRSQQGSPRICEIPHDQRSDDLSDAVDTAVNESIAIDNANKMTNHDMEIETETPNLTDPTDEVTVTAEIAIEASTVHDSHDILIECVQQEDIVSNEEEPALTLLSLLKQGPNFNPACPVSTTGQLTSSITPVIDLATTAPSVTDSSYSTADSASMVTHVDSVEPGDSLSIAESDSGESESRKNKAGICSSLLAVIEQLHERSRYDTEVVIETKVETKPLRRSYKRKFKEVNEEDTSIENLENVEKTDDDDLKYRCKLCHYTNSCVSVLKQHMRLHKTKKPFECSLCNFVGESTEALQEHMILHCKVRMYQCKLCDSAFSYKSQLRAHMRAHIDRVPFVCKHCTYATSDAKTFRDHVYAHYNPNKEPIAEDEASVIADPPTGTTNNNEPDENAAETGDEAVLFNPGDNIKGVKCPHCSFTFTTYSGMKLHARMHLIDLQPLKCALCEFYAVSNRSLKSHMKRHINDQRYVQQPLEQYRCNICGYVCHHLPSLKSHMWRHASDRNYSYEFTNEVINKAIDYDLKIDAEQELTELEKTNIAQAMMKVEKRGDVSCFVTFVCCQCGFETIDKASLSSHMKIHADIIKQTMKIGNVVDSNADPMGKEVEDVEEDEGVAGDLVMAEEEVLE